jgi:hypothetical protein
MPDDVNAHGLSTGLSHNAMMAQRLNRVAGEFLLVDAETALTLLDIAEMSRDSSTAQNDFDRASEALATINHFLEKLDLESDLRGEVESARDQLRERVKSMWPQFRS